MYEGMPKSINATDTSAGWHEAGQKLLVTGTVYKRDGKTPAPNVVLYYWQTNSQGLYAPAPNMNARARRHGHIRGWLKTDAQGYYALYTIRPAPYPNDRLPAHIHVLVKEPNIANEYYIEEFVFDDDQLLTTPKRKAMENRGGSGVLRVLLDGKLQVAEHNIILGLNIPNYPASAAISAMNSGLNIGEDSPSFIPYHAWGPDKGTRACPVCKYGRHQGLLYFVGNQPDWDDIARWLTFLEQQSVQRGKYLKVYFVYGNPVGYNAAARQTALEALGRKLNLQGVALTYVPSLTDTESEVNLNEINPQAQNTFILYRNRNILDKFVNLPASEASFKIIAKRLDEARSTYDKLPEPHH
jgi:protocatechuate 3,4-dioxygenase beta subunit